MTSAFAAEAPVAWWSFDANEGRQDAVIGHHEIVPGVRGLALRSDEFETAIECEAASLPAWKSGTFTVEAWIAPRALPWNYCPIIEQRDKTNGFYFGINYQGQLQLTPNSLTRFTLTGMTDGSTAALAPLARSYHQPPAVSIATEGCQSEGFSVAEKAFILTRVAGNAAAELELSIAASTESPLVNPAFVVREWGGDNVSVSLNGNPVPLGDACRVGFRATPTGRDLILWLQMTAESPTRLGLKQSVK